MEEENAVETVQRYRRDRRVLLDFILSGNLIKKVIMPPGAVSLDDVDLDQVSVDYVLNCARKGDLLELSEAIRAYHDSTLFPNMNNAGSTDEFFLVTYAESSGSPPRRTPPPLRVFAASPIMSNLSMSRSLGSETPQAQELTAGGYCKRLNLSKLYLGLIMRWVNSQLERIIGWVERAIQQERWEPISPQLKHGSSIVEVYRIVDETIEQFFLLKVPMRDSEMKSLFHGIDHGFQVYANNVAQKLSNKEDLIPPVPILTRYSKEAGIKAFVKKERVELRLSDMRSSSKINVLTTPTLCVQLNTLYYAVSQLTKLEDSIWERWTLKKPRETLMRKSISEKQVSFSKKDSFDGSRKDINAAIDQICEFTGTKIVFWDLREPFIENLYKPNVSQSRLEAVIEPLDTVLNQLCDIIVEPLRDWIVTSLLQASLNGLHRVLLDGGPSRIFVPGDAKLLEEDIELLKEFFISGGDGLPRGVVENQVARIRLVIKLLGYETRELIEDLKSASGLEMQGSRSKLGTDTKTLLRILCHRSDTEASQFAKKQFKIPKSSSVS